MIAMCTAVYRSETSGRYDSMLWMRDLKEGVAYLPD
jgi:hypothetical protein